MAPEAGLGGWHNSQSRASSAVFLSGQSVEGRSDRGNFGPADWGARVRIRCQAILALNAPAIRSVGEAIWPRLLHCEACPRLGSGEARSCPLSGWSLDLNCAHQASTACADGDYQPSLGVFGVPLIMVPDTYSSVRLLV
jgi:hypothetical protein